jgi:hypothetical protein
MSASVRSVSARSRLDVMMTSAHSEANRSAVARPIPFEPPVTTTMLSENLFCIRDDDFME